MATTRVTHNTWRLPQVTWPVRLGRVVSILGVGRTACLRPHRAEVDQLAFQAFDLKPQRGAARTRQGDHASRRVAFVELDCEPVEHRPPVLAIDIAALDAVDAIKPQRCAATLELRGFAERPRPVEPV